MKLREYQIAAFLLLALVFLTGEKGYGQEKAPNTTKQLQEVVDLIEDPNKRAVFVNTLKNLIKAKEEATRKEEKESAKPPDEKTRVLFVIELFFSKFEALSTEILTAAGSTASLISKAPMAYQKIKVFISAPENQVNLLKLLANITAAILIAFGLRVFLQKSVHSPTDASNTFLRKVIRNVVQMIFALIPYGALLISLFILFSLFPSFPMGHSLTLIFFTVLLFYQVALKISRALISPDVAHARILPINDEKANYYWIWVQRFAHYTAIYFLAIQSLTVIRIPLSSLAFIRGVLLAVFPFMISVFVLQVAREIRLRYERSQREREDKAALEGRYQRITKTVVRYWAPLVVAYSWAIFLLQLLNCEMGFFYLLKASLSTAVIIVALILTLRLQEWVFKRFFAISEIVKERFPGLEDKTNRYIVVFRKALSAIFVIIAIGMTAGVWGVPITAIITSKAGSLIILRVTAITIAIGAVIMIVEISSFLSDYLLEERKGGEKKPVTQKTKTLIPILRTSVKIAAGFVGGIIILDQLGVDTAPILAGAGIVGLAVGFGAQTLVKDVINGLFILFEESIRVGDYTDLGQNGGIVEAVGLRTVKLRDVHGNFHVVPNSSIDRITNMSKEFSRSVIDVGVAYREDVDQVIDILREIGEGMLKDPEYGKTILEPMEVLGLQSFEDSAVVIRVRFTTEPLKQWGLRREFNRRVKRVFDERGIEIPFPHRTVYMGEPKQGKAPELNVQLSQKTTSP